MTERPSYDHVTQTHYIALPKGTFAAIHEPLAMFQVGLFVEMISPGEYVDVLADDGEHVRFRVSGIAAVCEREDGPPLLGGTETSHD